MEKQIYLKPEINKVQIDNEISVVLMSAIEPTGAPPAVPPPPSQE